MVKLTSAWAASIIKYGFEYDFAGATYPLNIQGYNNNNLFIYAYGNPSNTANLQTVIFKADSNLDFGTYGCFDFSNIPLTGDSRYVGLIAATSTTVYDSTIASTYNIQVPLPTADNYGYFAEAYGFITYE
jgi:hypothetical protein